MLYSKCTGTGKTIVFIHGNSQSSATWNQLIKEPSLKYYRLLCVDLPGHGQSFRSTEPQKDYTLKGMAEHLKYFLDSLTEEYIIIANSLGCNFASEIITQLTNCKGLFLTGASVIGANLTVPEIVQPNPYVAAIFTHNPTDQMLEGLIGDLTTHIEESVKADYIRTFRDTDPAFRTEIGIAISRGEWSDEVANLEQLKYTIAIVYGAEEKIIFPDYLNKFAIKMWKEEIIKIPAAGHCPQLDRPAYLAGLINQYATAVFR